MKSNDSPVDFVKTVNGISPDSDGRIEDGPLVYVSNSTASVTERFPSGTTWIFENLSMKGALDLFPNRTTPTPEGIIPKGTRVNIINNSSFPVDIYTNPALRSENSIAIITTLDKYSSISLVYEGKYWYETLAPSGSIGPPGPAGPQGDWSSAKARVYTGVPGTEIITSNDYIVELRLTLPPNGLTLNLSDGDVVEIWNISGSKSKVIDPIFGYNAELPEYSCNRILMAGGLTFYMATQRLTNCIPV
ncbi:TPA: hypothetical protein QCI16_002331 [Enterobacter ludwigii]|uniref:hypothetical protein n=1 Tax=Enterobacter sp. PTB TaxID=3143437 RepID=UPI0033049CF3|nr:hypothetical protein [Enterobacter ludwigii]HDR2598161.1 hypothetical protein [Enterobacter ludwigii]